MTRAKTRRLLLCSARKVCGGQETQSFVFVVAAIGCFCFLQFYNLYMHTNEFKGKNVNSE